MNRSRWQLRDAAVGYAARGIPVLPLHYSLAHRTGLQPVPGNPQPAAERASCSCRDPGCGQVAKHPLGSLVPHGVKDATTNRARILAWWTRHPQANIGLATGHRFDVLDVDGPAGAQAIRELAATHGFQSSGPLVRTGGGGGHLYLAPTGLGNVADKTFKNRFASLEVNRTLQGRPGIGPRPPDDRGVTEIASPVGVVLGLIPMTNPVATLVFKTLICLKARNALIVSHHPAAAGVGGDTVALVGGVLAAISALVCEAITIV